MVGGREGHVSARGATPLVGRADELAIATAALSERGCVIVGAAGVGKSRLATEAAALAAQAGVVERVIGPSRRERSRSGRSRTSCRPSRAPQATRSRR